MVGTVGAAGFGCLIHEQSSSFDYGALGGTVLAVVDVSLAVDRVGTAALRG